MYPYITYVVKSLEEIKETLPHLTKGEFTDRDKAEIETCYVVLQSIIDKLLRFQGLKL